MAADVPEKQEPDEVLVQRSQGGETAAFDELVRRYSPRLYGLVYNMTSNKEDTYDLLQDVFAKAYRSIRKFQGRSSFYTWVHTIAVNMTINHIKKRNRKAAFSLNALESGAENDPALVDLKAASNPRKQARLHEIQKKLNIALQSLSEKHRLVVILFDIQGIPHAEISKILGVSEGTVRSRLHYAHQELQNYLRELLD